MMKPDRGQHLKCCLVRLFVPQLTIWLTLISSQLCGQSTLKRELADFLQRNTSEKSPAIAVLLARDGQILAQSAGGLAQLDNPTPASPQTKFRIGSVSKQFTAMAILRLVDQGKLTLNDRLQKFFPQMPNAESITLTQLLNHTSGLANYTEKIDFLLRVTRQTTPESIIGWFQKDSPIFAPGEKFAYCNTGYFLLGEIVKQVSGYSLGDFLQREFFEPLGMRDTGIYDNAHPPALMATGYEWLDQEIIPALDWNMTWAGGAGAMYSTVEDLFRWNEALFAGKVVSPALFQLAIQPVELPAGADGLDYGFGLVISQHRRIPMIHHSGGLNGWTSELARFPEQRCTIVVLTNRSSVDSPNLTPSAISAKFADLLLAEVIQTNPPLEVDPTVSPAIYGDYVGRYDYEDKVLSVTIENDRLFVQLTDQPKFEIFPAAKDQFFLNVVEAQIGFKRDDTGKVVGAVHQQSGSTFAIPKIEGPEITPAELDAFVGRYRYGVFAILVTTRQRDQLYAQLTGQPRFPIFASEPNKFRWRAVEAEVEFLKDEQGRVIAARHSQGGATFDAPRLPDRQNQQADQ
jgi:CubicO group peptidase (beta-lactamase class C family)